MCVCRQFRCLQSFRRITMTRAGVQHSTLNSITHTISCWSLDFNRWHLSWVSVMYYKLHGREKQFCLPSKRWFTLSLSGGQTLNKKNTRRGCFDSTVDWFLLSLRGSLIDWFWIFLAAWFVLRPPGLFSVCVAAWFVVWVGFGLTTTDLVDRTRQMLPSLGFISFLTLLHLC